MEKEKKLKRKTDRATGKTNLYECIYFRPWGYISSISLRPISTILVVMNLRVTSLFLVLHPFASVFVCRQHTDVPA